MLASCAALLCRTLHVKAQVHAQKAQEASSSAQSLQATAQAIAATHTELVQKIETVRSNVAAVVNHPQVCRCEVALSLLQSSAWKMRVRSFAPDDECSQQPFESLGVKAVLPLSFSLPFSSACICSYSRPAHERVARLFLARLRAFGTACAITIFIQGS